MTETDINHKSALPSDIKTIVVAYNAPRNQSQTTVNQVYFLYRIFTDPSYEYIWIGEYT